MKYESVRRISIYLQWFIVLAGIVITIRGVYIIINMTTSFDDGVSLSSILSKLVNRIKALVILVIVEALIEFVKKYLF